MRKSLQILKNLLGGGGLKPLQQWACLFILVFYLKTSFCANFTHNATITESYIPGSIKGKYKYGTIDSGFFYNYWLANTLYSYYGNDANAVRESQVPSAMVDVDGVLYTIDLCGIDTRGADFYICKYTSSSDGSSISLSTKHYYPWETTNCGSTPELQVKGWDDAPAFKKFFHNCLQPCIAQEMRPERSDYLAIFFRIAPERYFNGYEGNIKEGLLYQDFRKSDLATSDRENYFSTESWNPYWIGRSRYRKTCTSSARLYDLEKGAYRAWKYSYLVHLDFIDNSADGSELECIYHQYNSSWQTKSSFLQYKEAGHRDLSLSPRYIWHDGYVYSIIGSGYHVILYRWGITDSQPVRLLENFSGMNYLETTNWGHTEASYDFDFFIENGNNGKKIFCFLSFSGGGSYVANTSSYNWNSTYCNWTTNYAALLLQSVEIPDTYKVFDPQDPGVGDWVQNVIYITPYTRASGNFVDVRNTSKAQVYRLYQNTHRMCQYITSTGNKYVIYCYCYPGKEPQLYLGYAPYWIDSNNKIVLGPKCEFRQTADQWSESIANCFTHCSRIISMDCRAGHLWITWMNEDNSIYYYFHILAKDLVGE